MKRLVVGMAVVMGVTMCRGLAAEDVKVGVVADVPVLSAYVWRGQVVNDAPVLEPSVTITKGGFALNFWENYNFTDKATGHAGQFSEVDLTASYSATIGPFGLSGGLIEYLFPNQTLVGADGKGVAVPSTREVYASAALANVFLSPTFAVYYDVDSAKGVYGLFSIGYGTDIVEKKLKLALASSVGAGSSKYDAYYFGVDSSKMNDFNVGASVVYTPLDYLSITPGVQYTCLLDSSLKDAAGTLYKDKDQVIWSVKASYTF